LSIFGLVAVYGLIVICRFVRRPRDNPSSVGVEATGLDEHSIRQIAHTIRPGFDHIVIPHFRTIDGNDEDVPVQPGGDQSSAGLTFGIQYGDVVGDVTQRVIRVISVHRDNAGAVKTITAWCYLRNAIRTFRADRIMTVYDYKTGEVIDNWVSLLNHDEADKVAYPDHAAVMTNARPGLKVLIWLARSNTIMTAGERQVMIDYVYSCLGDGKIRKVFDQEKLMAWVGSYRPTPSDAVTSLLSLARTPPRFNSLKGYCVEMVKADGYVDETMKSNLMHLMQTCQAAYEGPPKHAAAPARAH
jgi:hypothetical protein